MILDGGIKAFRTDEYVKFLESIKLYVEVEGGSESIKLLQEDPVEFRKQMRTNRADTLRQEAEQWLAQGFDE